MGMNKKPRLRREVLRHIMQAEDIRSLREVSRRTGIDLSLLSRFMNGERDISQRSLELLAQAFPAHTDKLLKPKGR